MKKQNQEQETINVTLSNGTIVTAGPISWRGYKSLRESVVKALGGPAKEIVSKLLRLFEGKQLDIEAVRSDPEILSGLSSLICEAGFINDLLVNSWPVLIKETCTCNSLTEEDVEDLSAPDFLKLCEAASKTANLPALLSAEGNSLAALLMAAK